MGLPEVSGSVPRPAKRGPDSTPNAPTRRGDNCGVRHIHALPDAIDAACKQHLGKLGSKADLRTALANDLLVLLCGVRVALLWDYWVLDGTDADDDAPRSLRSTRSSMVFDAVK